MLEGDAKNVVQMLQGVKSSSASLAVIITDTIHLLSSLNSVSFIFVPRDCNRVANVIVKYALSIEYLSTTWEDNFSGCVEKPSLMYLCCGNQ